MRRLSRALFRERETRWWFAAVFALIYVAQLIWTHSYHELWRDEVHLWAGARVADGFWDLVTGDRVYDGHPLLFYWWLRIFRWFTDRSWGLRAANIVLMGSAALLFLRFAPFPRLLKLLLLASYLLGYEYGILSRNYGIGWLLVVAFCCLYDPLRPRLVGLSIVLGLLTFTNAFGAFLAGALFLSLLPLAFAIGPQHESLAFATFHIRKRFLICVVVVAAALAFSIHTTVPPTPSPFPGWNFATMNVDGLKIALERVLQALLPVRGLDDVGYWDHQGYFWDDHKTVAYWLATGLVLLIARALVPRWSLIAAFAVGLVLISVFPLVRYGNGMRHIGHLFMLVVALFWISLRWRPRARLLPTALLLVIGVFQLESFYVATVQERKYVFSDGGEMAEWIERAGLQDLPIVAGPGAMMVPVMGILNRNFISSESEEINQTMVFHGRYRYFSAAALVQRAVEEVTAKKRPVLVLCKWPLQPSLPPELKFSLLYKTTHVGQIDESYWLYRLER